MRVWKILRWPTVIVGTLLFFNFFFMLGSWEIAIELSKAIPGFKGMLVCSFFLGFLMCVFGCVYWKGKEVY